MNSPTDKPMTPTQTHTPGPWHVETRSSGHRYNGEPVKYFSVAHTSATRDGYVALDVAPVTLITSSGEKRNAEGEANARLIAAAPDLLAALKHARALVAARDVTLDRAALAMYDAAIARATGQA